MVFIRPYQESDFEACAHICRATLPPSLSTTPITAKLAPYVWTHQYTHLSPTTCHMLVDDAAPSDASGAGDGKVVGYCIGCPDVFAFAEQYPSYITSILSTAVAPPPSLGSSSSSTSASGGLTSSSGPTTSSTAGQGEEEEPFWIPDDTTLLPTGAAPLATSKKPNPAALIRLAYDPVRLLSLDGSPRDLSSSSSASSFEGGGWRATMHIDLLPAYQRRGWGRRLIEAFVRSVQASGADYGRGAWIGIAPDNAQVVSFYEKVGFRLATPPAAAAATAEGSGGGGGEDGINMVIDIPPKV